MELRSGQVLLFLLTDLVQVSYDQLSSHFLAHETKADGSAVSFPCVACGLSFGLRRELDRHTKLKHGTTSSLEKLNLLSDSSDDEDPLDQVSENVTPNQPKVLNDEVKCDRCFRSFRTNKALQIHLRESHKTKTPSKGLMLTSGNEKESPSSMKFGCQICTKRFHDMRELRTHYTLCHFREDLCRDYKHLKSVCKICQLKYPTEDHLIQHMANFHSMIDKYLLTKGLRVVSKEKSAKLLSWKCEICKVNQASSSALKSHLSVKHYQRELLAEHPIGPGKVKKCPKCSKLFDQTSLSTVVAHVGSYHDEVIKYAAHHLDIDPSDVENIPLDDFDDGTVGIPVDTGEASLQKIKRKKKKSIFDFLQCQICLQELVSSCSLKIHYIRHFEEDFKNLYFSTKCPHCDKISKDIFTNQRHIASDHEDLSLVPFMEARGLWVDKSLVLEEGAARLKRNDVRIKKLDQREIRQQLQEIEISKSVTVKSHGCEIVGCERSFGSEEQLLIHLTIEHFWSELCQEYGESYSASAKRCVICSEALDPALEKTGYFKHLAVAHRVVLKYVDRSRQVSWAGTSLGTEGIKIKLTKMAGRMEPPAPSVQVSSDIEAENQANVVIKREDEVEQGASLSKTNGDLLINKIRNIFSDDSDSE